jgi:hypothetical protein
MDGRNNGLRELAIVQPVSDLGRDFIPKRLPTVLVNCAVPDDRKLLRVRDKVE